MAITVTFLELTDPAALRPPQRPPGVAYTLERADGPEPARRFYTEIGRDYEWTDRLPWPPERWAEWTAGAEGWIATVGGEPAGYFSLRPGPPPRTSSSVPLWDVSRRSAGGAAVEMDIFGLVPAFVGAGIGGHLLADALRRGLELAPRVWLHTCTLDHSSALPNYEARGMRAFRREARG